MSDDMEKALDKLENNLRALVEKYVGPRLDALERRVDWLTEPINQRVTNIQLARKMKKLVAEIVSNHLEDLTDPPDTASKLQKMLGDDISKWPHPATIPSSTKPHKTCASDLVERVEKAIIEADTHPLAARAAIREVADWLDGDNFDYDEYGTPLTGIADAVTALRSQLED